MERRGRTLGPTTRCVTLNNFLTLSEPPFSRLQDGCLDHVLPRARLTLKATVVAFFPQNLSCTCPTSCLPPLLAEVVESWEVAARTGTDLKIKKERPLIGGEGQR